MNIYIYILQHTLNYKPKTASATEGRHRAHDLSAASHLGDQPRGHHPRLEEGPGGGLPRHCRKDPRLWEIRV